MEDREQQPVSCAEQLLLMLCAALGVGARAQNVNAVREVCGYGYGDGKPILVYP